MTLSYPLKIVTLFTALLLLVLAACTPATGSGDAELPTQIPPAPTLAPTDEPATDPAPPATAIDGVLWSLQHTVVGGDAVVPIPAEVVANLQIDGEQVSGLSGCNRFNGTVTRDGESLLFGPLATTRMACPEPRLSFEAEFLALLTATARYRLINGDLELLDENDLSLARFARGEEKTLFVGPEQVDCVGVAPQKCLLVAETPGAEYTFFYDTIAGFDWQPGYEYELRVRVVPISTVPADASSLRYELVEVVRQTAVEGAGAPALVGPTWQWTRYADSGDGESFDVADPARYTLTFQPDGTYALQNDCNQASGAYEVDGAALRLLPGPTTLAECGDDSLDLLFITFLADVDRYLLEDELLHLTIEDGARVLLFAPAE